MTKNVSENSKVIRKLKKLWKNGVFRSLCFIVLVILGVLAFREVLVLVLRTEYPLQTPISPSMRPTLNEGDLLIVQGGFSGNDIYAHLGDGDIIVFRDPGNSGNFIVHRAVDKFQIDGVWYIVTKGDNNGMTINDVNGIDYWPGFPRGGIYQKTGIPESYLIGKVIWHIPFLGYVKIYLGTPTMMLITLILIVAFLLLENLASSSKAKNIEDTKKN
ncbi:MAG: signal peptidase I [Candidatus Bathyarchaeia archaeon]